jgi:hypothetical protein
MILLAKSVVSEWLPQSDLSKKDQRALILLQWMNICQNRTTFLCNGFIVVLRALYILSRIHSEFKHSFITVDVY